MRTWPLWARALAGGAATGVLLAGLTFVVARYGPSFEAGGAAWSLRGNGALIVPFGLGPVVLVLGWVLVMWRGQREQIGCGGLVVAAATLLFGLLGGYVLGAVVVPAGS